MRRLAWIVAVVALAAGSVAAEPKPAKAAEPSACKRRVVGRGLERKVVCELTGNVVVKADAPKPSVLIVPRDGKNVTGRPRSTDPLRGLSRRLRD